MNKQMDGRADWMWVNCESGAFLVFLNSKFPCVSFSSRPLNVTLVFQSKSQRFVRVGLAVPLFSTVSKLREMVAEEGKISPDQVSQTIVSHALLLWENSVFCDLNIHFLRLISLTDLFAGNSGWTKPVRVPVLLLGWWGSELHCRRGQHLCFPGPTLF